LERVRRTEAPMELVHSARPFRVETRLEGGVALLCLFGALDMFAANACDKEIRSAEVRARCVVLDLRGLSSIESSGVAVIASAKARSRVDRWKLFVVRGGPAVTQRLSRSPLTRRLRAVKSPEGLFPAPAER
jgi:anti-anti-sigma factor